MCQNCDVNGNSYPLYDVGDNPQLAQPTRLKTFFRFEEDNEKDTDYGWLEPKRTGQIEPECCQNLNSFIGMKIENDRLIFVSPFSIITSHIAVDTPKFNPKIRIYKVANGYEVIGTDDVRINYANPRYKLPISNAVGINIRFDASGVVPKIIIQGGYNPVSLIQ